ncbi:hypothetical protein Herbaro_01205 [Herbaspirillum sp. WKF16]|jgi:hypothetical protein|uniref:hypothetical protein n=1 Tax=Herbaspirillum sp. WKF16 TaxID=3028312 RepID=UPI0023A980A4|nr:hypothetical protein [Herbaspirillum sp. WKF16]WDZ96430.1 hypothetical protein Herbaro_01205 [Herbaspirillum sp. WKF16]
MSNDTGNWLSAEQAVLPDGTLREDLPLINKKLPALAPVAEVCSCGGIGCGNKQAAAADDAQDQRP